MTNVALKGCAVAVKRSVWLDAGKGIATKSSHASRVCKMLLSISASCLALSGFAAIPEGYEGYSEHDLSVGALTVEDGARVCVTGGGNTITVPANVTCDLLLNGITVTTPVGAAPLAIGDGATVRLQLADTSTLTGASGWAGVQMGVNGASLVFNGGTGKLVAQGGDARPGIMVLDGASFVMDEGASGVTVQATGGAKTTVNGSNDSAAGVGSYGIYDSGTVTVKGGYLIAKGGAQAAGVGTGTHDGAKKGGTCGDVTVTGGKILATTASWGCGIGGGVPWINQGGSLKNYTQTGGEVYLTGVNSPALGGASGGMTADNATDSYGGDVLGTIRIAGGLLAATSTVSAVGIVCPAIGGGGIRDVSDKFFKTSSGGTILIEGGRVMAIGVKLGIGSGGYDKIAPQEPLTARTTVKITGGGVIASGSLWGIGGPEQATSAATNLASVTISGGAVNGTIQVQPTNGEALGDRRVYGSRIFGSDRSPYYVSAGEGGPAYEYPFENPKDKGDWAVLWLPVGMTRLLDAGGVEMFVDVSTPEQPSVYDVSKLGILRMNDASRNVIGTGTWDIAGDSVTNRYFYAVAGSRPHLTLSNMTARAYARVVMVAGNVSDKTWLNLCLVGTNNLKGTTNAQGANDRSPITVNDGETLRIYGDGYLRVESFDQAAAIGQSGRANCGNIIIDSGTIYAYGGSQGAAIGCGKHDAGCGTCGNVTVNGGTVRAYGMRFDDKGQVINSSGWAAGIGGATAYMMNGGSLKSYTQTGGDVEVYGAEAAGLGGGGSGPNQSGNVTPADMMCGNCGPVKITGGRLKVDNVTYSTTSCTGAGIGGSGGRYSTSLKEVGAAGYLTSYEQTGGDVTVKGKMIGIGGGGQVDPSQLGKFQTANTTVKVTGGTLTVEGQIYAIGGQETPATQTTNLTSIVIVGGSVKLTGGTQIPVTNAKGTVVYEATPRLAKVANELPVDVSVNVPDKAGSYAYAYQGNGNGDGRLHFWLPEGAYQIGNAQGEIVDGRWWTLGLRVFVK